MHSFTTLNFPTDKPWLIIGKGPTFENIPQNYNRAYYTLGLNHVFQKIKVDVGLFIDLDVITHGRECFATNLLCPMYPHINFLPAKFRIDYLAKTNPAVATVADRLYYFSHSKKPCGLPIVNVRVSSSEAAFHILALAGVKDIRSVGIDGGRMYAESFEGLTPLTNGQNNFNGQFKHIESIIEKYQLRYKVL